MKLKFFIILSLLLTPALYAQVGDVTICRTFNSETGYSSAPETEFETGKVWWYFMTQTSFSKKTLQDYGISSIRFLLLKDNTVVKEIAASDIGSYPGLYGELLLESGLYQVRILAGENNKVLGYSDFFKINTSK